jgi:predicted MFS family arabinose efflux permease
VTNEQAAGPPSERRIVWLLAAVQFANVLDFMMVNPLGPSLAKALHVSASQLPTVMGSYTAAASVSGLLGLFFLDRFDRRKALVVTLFGLALGTFVGGLATSFATLTMTRVLAGIFGGPATSLTMAILADAVPAKRRGRAMGVVMGGFAVASVLGVPAGLWLAALGGWQVPFFAVGLVILGAAFAALRVLPPLADHLERAQEPALPVLARMLGSRTVRFSLLLTTITMMSGFILIPNIASYAEFNQGFPSEHLGWMYLLGGVASMVTTRVAGRMIDASSAAKVTVVATIILTAITWLWFGSGLHVPILVVSTIFFIAMGARGVAYNTTTSKVPAPEERARFQSLQSAVQHAAAALAAFTSSRLLSEQPDKSLAHMDRVAAASIGFSLLVPLVMYLVERGANNKYADAPPIEGRA